MAKKNQEKKRLEDLSLEELHIEIEENKKQIKRSTTLALSALVAVIALCMAWFIANNVIRATTSGVEAMSDNPFELASVGVRQKAEETYLSGLLHLGNSQLYPKYYDYDLETNKKTEINTEQNYQVGTAGLAWHLSRQERIYPGANGKLEFYIIPKRDELIQTTVTLELQPYTNKDENGKEKTLAVSEQTVQDLVKGHLLLFKKLDNDNGYSGWISPSQNTITIKPEGGFEKNVPYKVTVYWIWPKYFRNYIYNSRIIYGDLFANNGEDATDLINFVKSNKKFLGFPNEFETSEISKDMSDTVLDKCSDYYNQADEKMGNKMQFIYVNASLAQ